MAVNKAYSKYQANSISGSAPEELTLMLYNGLVRFIIQGQKAIDEKDNSKAHENIIRAQDIILEFQITLDAQYEISNNLMLLYDYMYRRLIDANVKKDKKVLDEILAMATDLRNTWEQAMKLAKEQAQASKAVK
jgi:flagellar secretion chaperone FliS